MIVKYIHENGTDPINGEPLTEDQLLEIKGRCNKNEREGRESGILINAHLLNFSHAANPLVKARPPSATSIPAILKLLQDEWVCINTILEIKFGSYDCFIFCTMDEYMLMVMCVLSSMRM